MSAWAQAKQRELSASEFGLPDMAMSAAEEAGSDMARRALAHVLSMDITGYLDLVAMMHNHGWTGPLDISHGFIGHVPMASHNPGQKTAHTLRNACQATQTPVDGQPALICRWVRSQGDWVTERWTGWYWADRTRKWYEAGRMER